MTCKPIGGEMQLRLADLMAVGRNLPLAHFGLPNLLLTDSGRSALRLALRDWRRRGASGTVWLPEYLCSVVMEACQVEGFRVKLYKDRPGLSSFAHAPRPSDNDAVVAVHYFGKVNHAFLNWLSKVDELPRRWGLIEDCVQSPYTSEVGERGDYSFISFRKWWAAPDGGALYARKPFQSKMMLAHPDETFVNTRLVAKLLREADGDPDEFLSLVDTAERRLSTNEPKHLSWISRRLLTNESTGAVLARRVNWVALMEGLREDRFAKGGITPVYPRLDAGEVPLAFPLVIAKGRRDALRRWLMRSSIYCPVHWILPKNEKISNEARKLSGEMLSIPLDQRYSQDDMQRVLHALTAYLKEA